MIEEGVAEEKEAQGGEGQPAASDADGQADLPAPVDLSAERRGILDRVGKASTPKELSDLTYLFNVSLTKSEMARAGRQSDLLDKVLDVAAGRIEGKPDALTDKDLLGYMGAFQSGLDRSREVFGKDVQASPTILVNHSEVNVNVDKGGLDRDSRERVMDAVKGILAQLSAKPSGADAIDADVIDADDAEEDDDEGTVEGQDSGTDEGRP